MTARFDKLANCPECGAHAVMAEVTHSKYGRTRYRAVCSRRACGLHRIPMFADCLDSQADAAAAWNGGAR